MRPRPDQRTVVLASAVAGAAALLAAVVPGVAVGLLFLMPALVAAALLLAGRYPGERAVHRLRGTRSRPRRRASAVLPALRNPVWPRIGSGELLARRLAGRGPPMTALQLG